MAREYGELEYYSWEEFEKDCEKIAKWAKGKNFKNVYGVPPSGFAVAEKISHLLNIPLVSNINDIKIDTLVVDSIIDTGKRIERLFRHTGRVAVATIYVNKKAGNFYVRKKKKRVIFPWEAVQ